MSGSLNRVTLIGNLGKDPEIRRMQTGKAIANFSIATSEQWKDKVTGEKKENTQWHRIVCFNDGLCDVIDKYLKKGSKVYIEGSLQTRKWQDQQGNDRWSTEIVLSQYGAKLILLGDSGGRGVKPAESEADFGRGGGEDQPFRSVNEDMNDKIPF